MNQRICLSILAQLILFSSFNARGAEPSSIDQSALAKRLILPRLEMHGAWPDEVIDFIRRRSADLDPDKKGVNLIAFELPASAIGKKKEGESYSSHDVISFSLANVSILDAIIKTAKLSKLEVTIRKDAIFVHPKDKKP